MTGHTINGTKRPVVPVLGPITPIHIGGIDAANDQHPPETHAAAETPTPMPDPAYDPVKLAEADRIRALADAEVEAKRIEAEGRAEAEKIRATEDAERQRIANERARMRLEKDAAEHAATIAKKAKETAEANAAAARAEKAAADQAEKAEQQLAEQERSETWWKWGARGIYAVGLIIAAPVQFLHFWDRQRPFLVAAPALLEGLALVLAFGAAWAVAHRRDVAPYRIGIMLGAMVAAGINMYGGMSDERIGFNAGLIGAIASLGGPIVLMAYEHGIAQKADGIPSRRERRAARKAKEAEARARAKAKAERDEAARKAAEEKAAREAAAEAEQKRKDADRQSGHEDVWVVAEAQRSARGLPVVTDALWAEAWLLVTGSTKVGIRPEIEAASRSARQLMKDAVEHPSSLVESQMSPREKRDPNAPDGRRFNGGTPPRRTPGDTAPFHPAAKIAAADTARQRTAREDS